MVRWEGRTLKIGGILSEDLGESTLLPSLKMDFLGNKIVYHFKLWKTQTLGFSLQSLPLPPADTTFYIVLYCPVYLVWHSLRLSRVGIYSGKFPKPFCSQR